MVHERGIEVAQKSMKATDKVVHLTNKIELQSLLGKINFIRRFYFKTVRKDSAIFSSVEVEK
jgi:hypothetical protein